MTRTLTAPCKHYWEVENGKAAVVKGTCKLCGAERQFPNYFSGCVGPEDTTVQQQFDREAKREARAGRRA